MKIKNRKCINKKTLFNVFFALICGGIGFLVAFFGNGKSYFENNIIIVLITLFGFSLTSSVFIKQSLNNIDADTSKLIGEIAKDLKVSFILICVSLIIDLLYSLDFSSVWNIIFNTLKYGMLIYGLFEQMDILFSFVIILKK